MNLVIGSGDIAALLSGKQTKAHQELMQKFVSNEKPYYNALESPIDACRIGAILEDRYLQITADDCFVQYKATCEDMNVFTSSLDFATVEGGKVVDFDELKSIYFTDFIDFIEPNRGSENIDFIKKKFKKYYNQVQCQLICTGLEEANLVFLAVYSYDNKENTSRDIKPNEFIKFRIKRDEDVISVIKERGLIFQQIKDYFTNK